MAYNYRKSNHILNKNDESIVYRYADGAIKRITYDEIAMSDPTFTKEDYKKLKEASDKLYYEEHLSDHHYHKYVTSTLDGEDDDNWIITQSLEDELFEKIKNQQIKNELFDILLTKLTESQRRRLLLNVLKGLSEREIAELEGVDRHAVHNSIEYARKKIKKFLKSF